MAHTTAEQRKQVYSQELAAYTLRQWQQVRSTLEKSSDADAKTRRAVPSMNSDDASQGAKFVSPSSGQSVPLRLSVSWMLNDEQSLFRCTGHGLRAQITKAYTRWRKF
ncbi:hypothetical protein OE88DRAFT_1651221 [Heliocybe sulcata]|uniref:Uncharacterized protein n=1 Tax=Heliocybe sulcata TaxID=5364 RepID=A0A5C3NUQ4_9AGAM|nr:hypothetical protein OE88DRAFT_1651221 [Heliocybe sulcata]